MLTDSITAEPPNCIHNVGLIVARRAAACRFKGAFDGRARLRRRGMRVQCGLSIASGIYKRKADELDPKAALGVILGLVTALSIGLFMVPRRYFRGDTTTFLVGMTFGAMAGNAIYWFLSGMPFSPRPLAVFSLIPGINWAVGTFAYAYGTHRVGLAKATGIKNTQVLVATAGAFLFFNEAETTQPALAFAGSGLVVATAFILSRIQHRDEVLPHASLSGYLIPIIASVLYGLNGLFMKILIAGDIPRPQMNLGIGIGAFLGGLGIYILVRRRLGFLKAAAPSQHALAILGGLIWALALVTMILAIDFAGLAVAWSLMNLSIVVSVLYGVVLFREVDIKRRWKEVAAGLAVACLGILALYLSKVFGGAV